jgi:signal transduction histidine kinase
LKQKRKNLTPEPFSIAELVQDVQQKNLMIAKNKEIDLTVKFPFDLPLVYADIGMMERVIQNLLDNSFKFTSEGGKITIRLSKINDQVRFSIEDTGSGISHIELPHIFDRFQRAKRINIKDNFGLGLGLTIVKKILEVHNISIDVKSIEGKGTEFSFNIPVYKKTNILVNQLNTV